MTGYELVSSFYSVNLSYLENHPSNDDFDRASLVLFLLGLIETVYIKDPGYIHPSISEHLNAN